MTISKTANNFQNIKNFNDVYYDNIKNNYPYKENLENFEVFSKQTKFNPKNKKTNSKNYNVIRQNKLMGSFSKERKKVVDNKIEEYYLAFKNSSDKAKDAPPNLLGHECLRQSEKELVNFEITYSTTPGLENKIVPKMPRNIITNSISANGGIICDGNWDIIKNDMFMLGAISKNSDFYFWTDYNNTDIMQNWKNDKISLDLLWDKNEKRARVLGREIFILIKSGYKTVLQKETDINQKIERTIIGFVPPKDKKNYNAKEIYNIFLEEIKRFDETTFEKFLNDINIPYYK